MRRRRSYGLVLLVSLAWASLTPYGVGGSELVRLRNALVFRSQPATAFDWTPADAPQSFLRDVAPYPEWATEVVQGLGLAQLANDKDRIRALTRHLLTSSRVISGGAIREDLESTHLAITREGRGYCADFIRVFEALATAAGFTVRSWAFSFDGYGGHGHIVIEVWNDGLRRWEMLDLFNNVEFLDQYKHPMSALQLREALQRNAKLPPWRPIEVGARLAYPQEQKLLEYYLRGLDQWYMWWGSNVFAYDEVVGRFGVLGLRPLAQLMAVLAGVQPAAVALSEVRNEPQRERMSWIRFHLLAVLALTLVAPVLAWMRRRLT